MYYLLQYQYGENAVERRAPHREAHLAIARELHRRGELLLGGAFAEPVDGAVFVFRTEDVSVLENFVRNDPYVASGLVTKWWIRKWSVVVGA